MTRRGEDPVRRRAAPAMAAAAACVLALLALLAVALAPSGSGPSRALGLTGAAELVAQTDASIPANNVTLFGASPAEAGGEVWGIGGGSGGSAVTVHYVPASGWSVGSPLLNAEGSPLTGFSLDKPEGFRHSTPSPLAARMTADGSGAMLGQVSTGGSSLRQVLLLREPGGAFQEAPPVPSGAEGLESGEQLLSATLPPMVAALEEGGGKAGALVVPVSREKEVDTGVLHYSATGGWTREPIEVPAKDSTFLQVIAIDASSPQNAWLLARLSSEYKPGSVALFRRHLGGGTPTWRPVTLKSGGEAGEPIEVTTGSGGSSEATETFTVPSSDQAQLLTVTSSGVWVDGQRREVLAPTTLYFQAEGEEATATQAAQWCRVPASAPAGTNACQYELPESLPTDYSRSFAWPGSSGSFGERLITGLRDGQMMRLQGSAFTLVQSLGGDAGATYGAAFDSPQEGWLGKQLLPVHITTAANAVPDRLAAWPVPFRYALTAVAPQPGVATGALSSEALAVGDRGEVARYHPGEGWFPETLPGPGGKRETPRLRAVAWPTAGRAFAVGDLGQMWLWRGETGLWEKDPATPLNFRGNLLGIAFDPNNSARGYAVGQSGVLLSYGKSWSQEPEEAIPAPARGASFTAVAFAGSEAIVAWRKLKQIGQEQYAGGIIVNDGSGWREDPGADAALAGAVPWAVAALPDGGAAFSASNGTVVERNGAGAAWQAVPYPKAAPLSLAVFREGGAVRAIGTGVEPRTFSAEEDSPPPPGYPPLLFKPYPLFTSTERGVLRQTASGWEDEEHELNDAYEAPGEYVYYDMPYTPDPANAILVSEDGRQGWAVGGYVSDAHPLLDTSDVYRYPADGTAPPGIGSAPETATGSTFAIGGGAGCAAPCAARANTRIGPDVWLSNAIEEAGGISGVQAFLYTGPRVTPGITTGPPTLPVPYAGEEQRYAQLLSGHQLPVYPAASPTDAEPVGSKTESAFAAAFSGFPSLGAMLASHPSCPPQTAGCDAAYYSLRSAGTRLLMLDTSGEVGTEQLAWLKSELESASAAGEPAIAVGNADLPDEVTAGRPNATAVAEVLEAGNASAYFFDAPERNIHLPLGTHDPVPAFGSGTLGYVYVQDEEQRGGFTGQSGFLLAQIGAREGARWKVEVKLVPNIGELAAEAEQGTLLRRSQAASFAGLARRPRAGNRSHNLDREPEVAPYVAIPDNCLGSACAEGIEPSYTFTSSRPGVGNFVERNLNSSEPNAVLHNSKNEPITQPGGHDGLFCAFNKGTTVVTLKVANLSYSLPVTVQAGSVRQPCGTTKLEEAPISQQSPAPPPVSPTPVTQGGLESTPTPVSAPPPAPAPATPPAAHPAVHAPPLAQPFLAPQPAVTFLPPFVPVPLPTPARPTPPSGTSAVTSPVEAAQKEEEEEAAPESVSAEASAYRPAEHEPTPVYLVGLVVLAAFAGASLRGRRGPRAGRTKIAPATLNTMRGQERLSRDRHGRLP